MGAVLTLTSIFLVGTACIVDHRILRWRLRSGAINALLLTLICISAYMAWIANLFYHDALNRLNYHPMLYLIRVSLCLSSGWLFCSVLRHDKRSRRLLKLRPREVPDHDPRHKGTTNEW